MIKSMFKWTSMIILNVHSNLVKLKTKLEKVVIVSKVMMKAMIVIIVVSLKTAMKNTRDLILRMNCICIMRS